MDGSCGGIGRWKIERTIGWPGIFAGCKPGMIAL
jgi:hypothetical protein